MTVDQLRKITDALEPLEFEHFGEGRVTVGDTAVDVEALVRWTSAEGGVVRFADPSFTLDAVTMPLPPNTIPPVDRRMNVAGLRRQDDTTWSMRGGMWTHKPQWYSRRHGNRHEYEVQFGELHTSREGEVSWQVIVVQGFNAAIFGRTALGETRAFEFRAFERDGVLVVLERTDPFGAPYAALIFRGELALTDPELAAVLSVSSLIGGRLVRLAAISRHAFDGAVVERTLYRHDSHPRRAVSPFRLVYPRDGVQYLCEGFGALLDAFVALGEAPAVEVEVAITHLLADAAFLDTEIRDLTLALDTLIESAAFEPADVSPHLEKHRFKALAKPLLQALKAVLSAKAYERAVTVLNSLNDPRHALRRDAFWSRVGFSPTEREQAALRHRHPLSHRGFLPWAQSGRDDDLQRLHDDVAVLRTLVNRCIFALLGWRHLVMNHASFQDEAMPGLANGDEPCHERRSDAEGVS